MIEQKILDQIEAIARDDQVFLAGASIHFDRKFIREHMPRLDKRLYYRMLDVSAVIMALELVGKKVDAKAHGHRVLEDIAGSIGDLQRCLDWIKENRS
jgi:oligoribonuclease